MECLCNTGEYQGQQAPALTPGPCASVWKADVTASGV